MFDLCIRNAAVVTPDAVIRADIGVLGGKIAQIGEVGPAQRDLDGEGRIVMPGGIDPHAHIEQMSGMGLMNADTFESATQSALLGGTTTVMSFAAQPKGGRLLDTVSDYATRAQRGAFVDHAFHVIVSDPDAPAFRTDLAALMAAGHRSVKLFTTYNIGLTDRQIVDVMAQVKAHGGLICVHAENDGLIGWTKAALLAAGLDRPEHHAISHPRLAEVEAVERLCRFAEFLDQPLMLFHISTVEGVNAVRAAQARQVPVWAETCVHYLLQTARVLDRPGMEGAKWMCSPPQRNPEDQGALWAGVLAGDLAIISSDHAPYRFDATGKLAAGPAPSFDRIANGLPGLQTRLPLLFDAMVSKGQGGPLAFARVTAGAAARLYGLPGKGEIAVGMDADLVLWNPARQVTYAQDDLACNTGYNPWAGFTVTGWPEVVLLRGQMVVRDGAVAGGPAGRWLPRAAYHGNGTPAAEVRYLQTHGAY